MFISRRGSAFTTSKLLQYHSRRSIVSFSSSSGSFHPARNPTAPCRSAPVHRSAMNNSSTQSFDLSSLPASKWTVHSKFASFDSSLIEVSPNDARQYRSLTLSNGLSVLLVSDPTTDKSAAALSVNIGHLSDPPSSPGLAHFLEHLLFLGTDLFPQEDEYKKYLSASNGSSNAYTSLEETLFHFDCSTEALKGGLERHSRFFVNPLFDPNCTEREVNAVDSEFRRNLQLDSRRLFQLGKHTSSRRDGTVYWKFGTGNKGTLWKDGVRGQLIEWYRKNYSANLMSLVVCGNESLDELQAMVVNYYSDIPNTNVGHNVFDASALGPEELGVELRSMISYRTIKDSPQLRIEFPLPDLRDHWASKPSSFISHYIGHEGPGSILAELKRLGWATSLSAGGSNGAAGFDFFRLNIGLTATGFKNYRSVLSIVSRYLDLLSSTEPQRWAWEEMVKLGRIGWRWKEIGQPTSLVKSLASRMATTLYPTEKIMSGPWFATKFNRELYKDIIGRLKLENCRVFVGSKEPIEEEEWDQVEPYYTTEYRIDPLNAESIRSSSSSGYKLALPGKNPFVPDNLELIVKKPVAEPVNRPTLVRQTSTSQVFHKIDDRWCIPRACVYFLLKSPKADSSPSNAMKTQLLTQLVEESLSEYAYDASLAGLSYSISNDPQGIELLLSGYSDKISLLLEVVLKKLKSLQVEDGLFDLVKERLMKAYKNAQLENPSGLADAKLRWLTRETYWTFEERLDALRDITPEQVQSHIGPLLKDVKIEALVHGNLAKDDAISLTSVVENALDLAGSVEKVDEYHHALVLPMPCNLVYRELVPSAENVNSAASVYYQVGHASDEHLVATLSLFSQIAKVPVFSTLRTKEQLGYIVSSSAWSLHSILGFRVIVQSEKSAEFLEERIEALWTSFTTEHLGNMKLEEFDRIKGSVVSKLREKVKNLGSEAGRYWGEIEEDRLDFDRRERLAKIVEKLEKKDVEKLFGEFLDPRAMGRRKLSVLMRSQRLQADALRGLENALTGEIQNEEGRNQLEELLNSKPTLPQLREAITRILGPEQPMSQEIVEQLKKLGEPSMVGPGVEELKADQVEGWRSGLERAQKVAAKQNFQKDLVSHL